MKYNEEKEREVFELVKELPIRGFIYYIKGNVRI
jgi:hypothetical protein